MISVSTEELVIRNLQMNEIYIKVVSQRRNASHCGGKFTPVLKLALYASFMPAHSLRTSPHGSAGINSPGET
jgi:hypothetical protein